MTFRIPWKPAARSAWILAFLLFLIPVLPGRQESALPVLQKTIGMPKVEGRIDHMAVDLQGQRLFVAALGNNSLEILDLREGKLLNSLSGFGEPQGIAYAADLKRLFVACGKDGNLRILDGVSLKSIATVGSMPDADNVRYDPKAGLIYVGFGEGALGIIDARSGAKVAEIPLAGHPESFRLEPAGPRIYVNVPSADHIAVVDRDKKKVVAQWPNLDAKANYPMILDDSGSRLFVGTRKPAKLKVYDTKTGGLISSLDICGDTDDLFWDAANRVIHISCGQGVIEVVKHDGGGPLSRIGEIRTAAGARTALFVPELKNFCLAVPHRGSQPAEIRIYKTP